MFSTMSQIKVKYVELNVNFRRIVSLNQIKYTFQVGSFSPQTSCHRIHNQLYCAQDVNMIIKKEINTSQQFYTFYPPPPK